MAGLQSLRTPDEVAEIRGLSVNQVLGLTAEPEVATETISADPRANGNGGGSPEAAVAAETPPEQTAEESEA
jgi:small subunit ribosomal protein S5